MTNQPTSLLHLSANARPTCTGCGSDRVTDLTMVATDGLQLTLVACHRCELHTWRDGQTALSLSEVLERACKRARPVAPAAPQSPHPPR